MKICLVLEGSYPHTRGGVSTWVNGFIRSSPEHEFVLWTINDLESKRGRYNYEIPDNVVEIHEIFLESALKLRVRKNVNLVFSKSERSAISDLVNCRNPDWNTVLTTFNEKTKNPVEFFMSEEFLNILKDTSNNQFPFLGFSEMFWTVRSMFLPLLYLIGQPFPEANLYHSISTGYAGVLGALASMKYNKPYVLTEHGIYTREREEEILRSNWILSHFKEWWVSMFYMYSRLAYQQAHQVTGLFRRAILIQQEIGCPPEKCEIVGNGVLFDKFSNIPLKPEDDWVDIAAIVRIAPIKDIKTMIYTFSRLKQEISNVRMHILGGIDDDEYYQECLSLVEYLGVKDIIFPGVVDIISYLEKIDFTLLTSLSEGQPFAIIESLAAGRPLVATDVGSCRELIQGDRGDEFGDAGICVPPMNQTELLQGVIRMCQNFEMRRQMGIAGKKRVRAFYEQKMMIEKYHNVYEKAFAKWQESGLN